MNKIFYYLLTLFLLSGPLTLRSQWMEQSSGVATSLNSVSGVNDNIAWVCGNAGRVLRTNNGGTEWINATGTGIPNTLDLYNIFASDSTTALVTGSNTTAYVYRTTNGGLTWVQVFSQAGGFLNSIWMTTAANGVMYGDPVGGRWSLWRTTNGGVNWDSTGMYLQQAGSEAGWNNAMYVTATNIWFGTNNSRVYYTPLSGLAGTWVVQSTSQANSYALWFNSLTSGMTGGTQLLMTNNSGVNWTSVTGPGSGNISGITGSAAAYWFVRQANSIYRTTDNGATFTTDYTAPAGTYTHIQKAAIGSRMWATRNNGGISSSLSTVGIEPVSTETPVNYSLSQNYPNPFNPATNINFSIPVSSIVSIKIYDIAGREVDIIANNMMISPGSYTVVYSADRLSSGIYFYRITANEYTETKKMVLTK
ncbi:MAG TPA: T9SS type A sorting domain-containing protein [Ignavibacteria bacterium]|nr:T9SS type A sorting domain-containing protein [Ignavibacteria bacterium]HRF65077.1 T9SS type A sorting domain-containing protein [Ignavibacteria bacterium]HRJ05054.1 T9SS type A sorting domain-containing protein [Ignavibacteria bacterium]HRJ85214.1 T9SS type A sorting domain-containing protein [Ignavibacteria bacterium]